MRYFFVSYCVNFNDLRVKSNPINPFLSNLTGARSTTGIAATGLMYNTGHPSMTQMVVDIKKLHNLNESDEVSILGLTEFKNREDFDLFMS